MKPVQFLNDAYLDYIEWAKENKEIFDKINVLIVDIDRNYFKRLGKPEPLKKNLQGYWSRRINDEHRLIYRVEKMLFTFIVVTDITKAQTHTRSISDKKEENNKFKR